VEATDEGIVSVVPVPVTGGIAASETNNPEEVATVICEGVG
jgi:hypothetical protein